MPGEGRGLGSREASNAGTAGRLTAHESRTSAQSRETADGAACESEGGSELPLLFALRQDVSRRRAGVRLPTVQVQQGRTGRGRPDVRGHRGVRREEVAGGTGEGTPGQDVSSRSGPSGVDPETGRQAAAVGDTDDPRPRG